MNTFPVGRYDGRLSLFYGRRWLPRPPSLGDAVTALAMDVPAGTLASDAWGAASWQAKIEMKEVWTK
jgi:hypothetical protein